MNRTCDVLKHGYSVWDYESCEVNEIAAKGERAAGGVASLVDDERLSTGR